MRLLISGCTASLSRLAPSNPDVLGHLVTPRTRNAPDALLRHSLPWAIDNGAFSGFDAVAFLRALDQFAGRAGCLWVVAPDVVGDAAATLSLFGEWALRIRAKGYPLAYVAQDGSESVAPPWDDFECLFIGGSTRFKLSPFAWGMVREAKERGKLVHVGRVNSLCRLGAAYWSGSDSVDGSSMSRFGDKRIPWMLGELHRLESQRYLWN